MEDILDEIEGDKSQFLESKNNDEVFDLFLELVPSNDQCQDIATRDEVQRPFLKKLQDIRAGARVKRDCVRNYIGAKLMHLRCERQRISKKRLEDVDNQLCQMFDSANDALPDPDGMPKAKAQARGRQLLDACNLRAEAVKMPGFTLQNDTTIAKGEFQCLANREGFIKRELTWMQS